MLNIDNCPCGVTRFGYQLSAFRLASHQGDVIPKQVGEGVKRLTRR